MLPKPTVNLLNFMLVTLTMIVQDHAWLLLDVYSPFSAYPRCIRGFLHFDTHVYVMAFGPQEILVAVYPIVVKHNNFSLQQ